MVPAEIETMKSKSIEVILKQMATPYYYSVTEDLTEDQFVEDFGEYDPVKEPGISQQKTAGKPIFSPLYKHFIKNDLVLTSAYPIYNQEGTSGRIRYPYDPFKSKRFFEGSCKKSNRNGLYCGKKIR